MTSVTGLLPSIAAIRVPIPSLALEIEPTSLVEPLIERMGRWESFNLGIDAVEGFGRRSPARLFEVEERMRESSPLPLCSYVYFVMDFVFVFISHRPAPSVSRIMYVEQLFTLLSTPI